eukprot:126524-Chlamydomonas_euryale.AAC.2
MSRNLGPRVCYPGQSPPLPASLDPARPPSPSRASGGTRHGARCGAWAGAGSGRRRQHAMTAVKVEAGLA